MSDRIRVTMSPDRIRAAPGKRAATLATIVNVGDVVETYSVAVEGPEAGWCTVSAWTLSVPPGEEAQIELSFMVPQDREYTPGHYDVVLRVVSKNDPSVEATGLLALQVEGVVLFEAELVPVKSAGGGGTYQLNISNTGNLRTACTLAGVDPGEKLKFEFERATTVVEPGGSASIKVVVRPRRRPIRGRVKECGFKVVATGAGSGVDEQLVVSVDGSLACIPLLPRRTLVGLGALLAVVLLAVIIPLVTGSGDTEAPGAVMIVSPSTPIGGQEVTFTATSDADDVERIAIYIDGVMEKECDSSPCEYVGGPYAAGDISYRAVVWDRAGNRGEAMSQSVLVSPAVTPAPVDSAPPTVDVASALNGDFITMTVEASDPQSGVEKIRLSLKVGDGGDWEVVGEWDASPSRYTGGPYPLGPVSYRATAWDTLGNEATSVERSVVVSDDKTAPEVELVITPADPTTGDLVTFTATATDLNGIEKIQIWYDTGHLLREGAESPISRTLGTFAAGVLDNWAFAWDAAGNRGGSGHVYVRIVE